MKKLGVNRFKIALFFLAALLLAGCSAGEYVYYEVPVELKKPELEKEFIQKYSPYIKDYTFFLDPGHGGEDRRNKGYENTAVEADLNLRVGLHLREFLEQAGAKVIMSRVKDQTVDLKERSYMANRSGADFFISIHHNAPGKSSDIWTNYTSTYYHAKESDYVYEPMERDMARFVQRDMAYAMRNSGGPASFDGTYSDYWIYPGDGFSVLRVTEIPAILVECGFNTSHFESARLVKDDYNKIEAWGIFRGLCRYFKAGIPKINFLNENDDFRSGDQLLSFMVSDSSGIDPESIEVEFDSSKVSNYNFDPNTGILSVNLKTVQPGAHEVRVIVANKNGNHNLPFRKEISVVNNQ